MLTVSDKTTWLGKLVLYLAYIPHNVMPKKISTKCNVFLQLRPHPHFTRHVRKKNPQNHPHFTRLKIRRSADPQIRILPEATENDVISEEKT